MVDLKAFDIKTSVTTSVKEVFDTMLSMDVEATTKVTKKSLLGIQLVASVSFIGDVVGSVNIQISNEFSVLVASAMLGMEPDEIEDDEDINDVLREVSNMVGGNLKSDFCDADLPCQLSVPSLTIGSNFKIEPMKFARYERFAFRHEDHFCFVSVCVKEGK